MITCDDVTAIVRGTDGCFTSAIDLFALQYASTFFLSVKSIKTEIEMLLGCLDLPTLAMAFGEHVPTIILYYN